MGYATPVNGSSCVEPGAYTAFIAVYLNENYMSPNVKAVSFRH